METNQINNQIYVAVMRLIKLTAALERRVAELAAKVEAASQ
jgi:hypothetical protein